MYNVMIYVLIFCLSFTKGLLTQVELDEFGSSNAFFHGTAPIIMALVLLVIIKYSKSPELNLFAPLSLMYNAFDWTLKAFPQKIFIFNVAHLLWGLGSISRRVLSDSISYEFGKWVALGSIVSLITIFFIKRRCGFKFEKFQ